MVLYTIYKELFSLESPQGLYTMASDQCMNHPKVQDLLGEWVLFPETEIAFFQIAN